MRWFSDREIVILASPDEFVFRGRLEEVRFAPVLWLTNAGQIAAVGDLDAEGESLTRVDIFKPQPSDPDIPRTRLLTLLLRYGLAVILVESVFKRKPVVRFGSLAAFDQLLSGFQREIFERAALDGGARQVRFEPRAA